MTAHRDKGGRLRRGVLASGLMAALLLAPAAPRAQECVPEETGCTPGGCPLRDLPYEEFIGVTPDTPAGAPAAAAAPRSFGAFDVPPVVDRPFDPDSGPTILVRGFVVENVTPNPDAGITQESVQAVADAAFKRASGGADEHRMTVGQMQRVSDEVTTFYRNSGYLVSKAFIPVQTIGSDAVVRIGVLEGRVSAVAVENASDYSEDVLRRPSEPLIGATPTRDSVESALLYTSDYPGLRVFGTFRPGAQTGETQLVLRIQNEERFSYAFGADNFGTDFTGLYRLRGDLAWNNPAGWGDELSLTLLQSVAPENTTYASLGYRVPFGPRGFGARVGASRNLFVVDEPPFDVLRLEGTIDVYEAGFDWRFKRLRLFNASTGLLFAHKNSELIAVESLKVTDDNFNVATLYSGLERTDTRFRGLDNFSLSVRQGLSGEFSSAGSFDPSFTVYGLNYSRIQALAETQFAVLRLNAQQTDKSLSPLERFTLAGPDKVRAYPVGDQLSDIGQFASLEYQVQAPGFSRRPGPFGRNWGDLLKFSLFADYAHGDSNAGDASAVLSGGGLGVLFGLPGKFQIQLQGATALSSAEASDGDDVRFYGNFSISF